MSDALSPLLLISRGAPHATSPPPGTRRPPRQHRPPRPQSARPRAHARVGHRPPHPASLPRPPRHQPGLTLSGPPALEQRGWIESGCQSTENNRRARYHKLTRAGRKALGEEVDRWKRFASTMSLILRTENRHDVAQGTSHRANLSPEKRRRLQTLLAANERLNTAYLLKEQFGQLWSYRRERWARKFFDQWRASLRWQRLKPFEKFVELIERHWDGIAAYCRPENNVALGFVEGLNNKIRVIQRRCYGIRDEDYLHLKILTCTLPPLPQSHMA